MAFLCGSLPCLDSTASSVVFFGHSKTLLQLLPYNILFLNLSIEFQSFAGEKLTFKSEKSGFWGVLARKAKAILEEDDIPIEEETSRFHPTDSSTHSQVSTNCLASIY